MEEGEVVTRRREGKGENGWSQVFPLPLTYSVDGSIHWFHEGVRVVMATDCIQQILGSHHPRLETTPTIGQELNTSNTEFTPAGLPRNGDGLISGGRGGGVVLPEYRGGHLSGVQIEESSSLFLCTATHHNTATQPLYKIGWILRGVARFTKGHVHHLTATMLEVELCCFTGVVGITASAAGRSLMSTNTTPSDRLTPTSSTSPSGSGA